MSAITLRRTIFSEKKAKETWLLYVFSSSYYVYLLVTLWCVLFNKTFCPDYFILSKVCQLMSLNIHVCSALPLFAKTHLNNEQCTPPSLAPPLLFRCLCSLLVVKSINHLIWPNDFHCSERLSCPAKANICLTFIGSGVMKTVRCCGGFVLKKIKGLPPTIKC